MTERVLPLRVVAHPDEPISSLCHRLATRWSMTLAEFQREFKLRPCKIFTDSQIQRLAALNATSADKLRQTSPRREQNTRRVLIGHSWTDVADCFGNVRRRCPICLFEDRKAAAAAGSHIELASWTRAYWSVKSVATCIIHRCRLTFECAGCLSESGPNDPAIDVCRCGRRLWEDSAAPAANRVDELLVNSLIGRNVTPHFAETGLSRLSTFFVRAGLIEKGWHRAIPRLADEDVLVVRDRGMSLVEGPDEKLQALLDEVAATATPGPSGTLGLTSAYGWIWSHWLGLPSDDSLHHLLKKRVREHALARGYLNAVSAGGLTIGESRAAFGSGHARARRIVSASGLLPRADLRGRKVQIDASIISQLAEQKSQLLCLKDAAAKLGIGKSSFRQLVTENIVRPLVDASRFSLVPLFDQNDLTDLVETVARGIQTHVAAHSIPITQACRNASVPLSVVLKALIRGEITATERTTEPGLSGICISPAILQPLAKPRRTSVRAACQSLNIHYEAGRWLAANGHFGSGSHFLTTEAISDFKARFCTSSELAASCGLSGKQVGHWLRSAGIEPAFGPPDCKQTVWPRGAAVALRTRKGQNA